MSEPLNTRPAAESHLVELTPQGLRRVRRWGISIALGSFLFGFDTGIVSGALLFMREDFALTSFQQGSVVSILLLGAVIGALTCGNLADRYGRRPILAALGIVFFIGIGAAAVAPGYWTVVFGRVVMGLAVGGVSATVPTYLGEMAPAQLRGRMLSLNQLFITFGLLTSYLVNWALAGAEAWRAMFGVGLVPAVLLFLAVLWLPESPTWLVRNSRMEQARKVVDKVAEPGDADQFISRVQEARREEDRSGSGGVGDLFRGTALPALLVAVVLAALQQFAGINTILYYAPTIMDQAGLSASNAIFYSIFIGTVNVIITFASFYLIDRIGRRPLLLGSLVGMTIAIALLGCGLRRGSEPVVHARVHAAVHRGVRDRHGTDLLGPSRRGLPLRPAGGGGQRGCDRELALEFPGEPDVPASGPGHRAGGDVLGLRSHLCSRRRLRHQVGARDTWPRRR